MDTSTLIDEVTAAGLLPVDRHAVVVAGSVAWGWDTPTSDVDVLVITAEPWPGGPGGPTTPIYSLPVTLDPDDIRVEVTKVAGRRCELKYWTDGQIDQTLAKVGWAAFEAGKLTQGVLSAEEYQLLKGLRRAYALEGADWLAVTKERLDASATRAMACSRHLTFADGLTEDATGHLAAGDTDSAVLTAWLAYGLTVDALLASHGELADNPKWRARRVREAALPELPYADFWAVTTMRDLDPDDPVRWVTRTVRACQKLSAGIDF